MAPEEYVLPTGETGAGGEISDDGDDGHIEPWTTTGDYAASGEGRHLFVQIAPARSPQEATKAFADAFGEFFAMDSVAERGVHRDAVVAYLFNDGLLAFVQEGARRGRVELRAHLHFNFS